MANLPDIDPIIEQHVGDIRRPRGSFTPKVDLSHLPGESGMFAAAKHLWRLLNNGNNHIRRMSDKFGPVYRHQLGFQPVVVVSEPEYVSKILKNSDGIWSSALAWRHIVEGLESGPVDMPATLDFDLHRDVRKLLQPVFKASAISACLELGAERFAKEIDLWADAGSVPFKSKSRLLFAEVATQFFLGIDDPEEAKVFDRSMAGLWRALLVMKKDTRISPTWRRGLKGYEELKRRLKERVEERRTGDGDDLFSRLCKQGDQVEWLDDDGLVRLFVGIMLAAFDTTSAGVTSMAYLLATHPEWQERLRTEALATPLSCDALSHYPQCEWAWKETLRLYPVASNVPRQALQDAHLGDNKIPAGTIVSAVLSATLIDKRFWTHPMEFDPTRFSPERAEDKANPGVFLPFGAGSHACIGALLSTSEAKVFWHTMLTKVRFELKRPYAGKHQFRPIGTVSGDVELKLTRL